jgi:ribonuclease HII
VSTKYLIGTDEAGYGPNLGPLVVSASVWQVPEDTDGEKLYELLDKVVARSPGRGAKTDGPVAFADSKKLYSPGKGLQNLERGLWASLGALRRPSDSWIGLFNSLAPEAIDDLRTIPWYADYQMPLPLDANAEDLQALDGTFEDGLAAAGVRLVELRSSVVFPERFNRLVRENGSKGTALSNITFDLLSRMIQPLGDVPISVVCDKHGGRNRYGALLGEHFPDHFIEVRGESRQRSVYHFGPPRRRVNICFITKGESHLPAALASMASKYLRELAMRALNDFWQARVHGLRATAGYPQDARRFKAAIAQVQSELGIAEDMLWRMK